MERPAESNGVREPVSRLMITKMVLENFKSYAGEQEIGPFHKRFSSVVGPNGSGKSNVIDALLFVFGKRAKQLRLNKVSELIHKSSRFPDLDFARVSVYFQLILDDEESEDAYTVVPGSEFSVTRVAYQNNQSKYSIDAKNSTYTEVGLVLRKYGIDLDNNRFLILQGEVEQIAMMKPKAPSPHEEGLLEYLEDIIGSNQFVERIDELSKVVDELNEQRVEKINRLKIAEKEKDGLEGPMKDAQLFLEKEADIRAHQNILYQYNIRECSNNKDEAQENVQKIKEKLEYERNKLRETDAKCTEMEKVYKSTNAEYDRLFEEMQRTADEFTAYERKDTKMIEDLKHVQQQMTKLKASITKDTKKESECAAELDECARKLKSLAADIAAATARKAEEEASLDEIMQGLSGATTALRDQLEVVQGKLADADRKVASLVTEKESVEMSAQLVRSRAAAAAKTLAANQNKLDRLNEERNGFVTKMRSLQAESEAAAAIIAQSEDEVSQLKVLETTMQGNIRTAVTNVEEAKAAMQQGGSGRSPVIDHLLKATRKGGPLAASGVLGRLGDLGTIPKEYDLAICLATGNMLDAIVVETADAARKCVSYVRDKGRITCIVLRELANLEPKMASTPAGMPSAAKRLFDLVTPINPAVRPAFYTAMRDTLVVRDLDTAVSVAYEGGRAKWRVITLDGNLIDQSGTMSGGGKPTRSGGGMGPSRAIGSTEGAVTEQTIKKLEGEVLSAQASLQECRAALADSGKRLKESKQRVKSCEIEIEKIELAMSLINEQITDISSRMSTLQQEAVLTAQEQTELAVLERNIAEINHRISLASPDQASLQNEAKTLQTQIMEIGGPKLKRAQAKVDAANETIETLSSALSSAEVSEGNARKQATKANAAKTKSEKELSKITEKHETLLAEQAEMEKEAEVVMVAMEQAKAAAEEHEIVLKNITKEHNALQALVNTIRSTEVDLTTSLEQFSKILKENDQKLSHWTRNLEEIRKIHRTEIKEQNSIAMSFSAASPAADDAMDIVEEEEDQTQRQNSSKSIVAEDSPWSVQDEELPILSSDELPASGSRRVEELTHDISVMEAEREKLQGNINLSAIEQFKGKLVVYRERMAELEEVTVQRDVARKNFDECRKQRLDQFMHGFGIITLKLKEMYQMITLGGDAELELVDSLDPFSEGIVFSVRPPKKSWKNISNLSGGEKTLSSLALVFALHHFKPTPLYVMDEIDAALDFKNVSIVANYIKERTKNAQFIIISLRNNMFELADRLVGIYKTNDATKSITINPKLFEASVQGNRPVTSVDGKQPAKVDARPVLIDSTNIRA